ncbi:hypothetical protein Leryth_019169 [Lithospermum erythrorhizon]|nr:hypothetical protein Leryth_019169 [Lithospermum erythrorhizon]
MIEIGYNETKADIIRFLFYLIKFDTCNYKDSISDSSSISNIHDHLSSPSIFFYLFITTNTHDQHRISGNINQAYFLRGDA